MEMIKIHNNKNSKNKSLILTKANIITDMLQREVQWFDLDVAFWHLTNKISNKFKLDKN